MINNYSYLDGLKVIMGNIPINIAALIVLIAYGRPPDCYIDEDRKEKANHIFAQLIIGHVLFTIFSVRNIKDAKKDVEVQVILVFYAVLIAIQLCHYWYFYEEQMIELKKTEEQRTFFLVLALELFTML